MKKIIIATLSLLVLVGAGCAAYETEDQDVAQGESDLQMVTLEQGLEMDVSNEWEVTEVSTEQLVFKTATDPYEITETVRLSETESSEADLVIYETDDLTIYSLTCAPAIGCYKVQVGEMYYQFDWQMVESTEVAPEELDAPWFPSANFDQSDVVEMMKTLRVVE